MDIHSRIKYYTSNKTLLNGTLFSLFSFINRGFGFILLLILAAYITPTEYGSLGLFSTVTMVIGYFMAMSSDGYLSIAYFKEGSIGTRQTVSCVFLITMFSLASFGCVSLVAGDWISTKLDLPKHIIGLAVLCCFFSIYVNLNLDYLRLEEKVYKYGLLSCGNALLNFVFSILFVKYLMFGWEGRVWAQLLCSAIFGIIGLVFLWKKRLFVRPSLSHLKKMLVWGIPLIPHLATTFIRQGCDRYIINYHHSIADVGLFSFALTLSNIILMVGAGFNQSNSVDIYKVLSDNNTSGAQKGVLLKNQKHQITIIYIIVSVLVVVGCYTIIPLILPKYSGAMNYFLILSIYSFLYCIYFLYSNFLFYYKRTKVLMYITMITAVLHLLASLLFTKYSLYNTCIIYCVIQLIIVLSIRYIAQREINKDLNK